MVTFKGLEAWITIDGSEAHATEYSVETDDEENTITCWIASEVGKVNTTLFGFSTFDSIFSAAVVGFCCELAMFSGEGS